MTKFAFMKAFILAGLFCLLLENGFSQRLSSQSRKTEAKRRRALIETAVNFATGTSPENPVEATLHLKNVGSLEARDVRLFNSLSISAEDQTRAENATFEHAIASSSKPSQYPVIGPIDVGQRDSMELHVPKLVPSQFAALKGGRSHVYVAGILHYQDANRAYEQQFCWVFSNGDPALGHKCQTHNEEKALAAQTPNATQNP